MIVVSQVSREEALQQMQNRFMVTVNLIRCLFAAAPQSQIVAVGAADFFHKNHVLVSQLLRMRYLSLDGLNMTESVLSVFAMLAAVPHSPLSSVNNGTSTGGGDALSLLGTSAESFVSDISMLLGVLGKTVISLLAYYFLVLILCLVLFLFPKD